MSAAHQDSAQRFFAAWSRGFDELIAAFDEHLSDDARWEQSGLPTTTSKAEAIGLMHGFREQLGLATVDVDLVHVVGGEGVVITERVDHLRADDGSLIASFPVMGALEFDDAGKVRAWREIFDPRAALALLATTNDA